MKDENVPDKGNKVPQPEIRERLLKEYLTTGYKAEGNQHEIVIDSVAYKVLERRDATVFYDGEGNTLFNVENKRLEKEYVHAMQEEGSEEKPGSNALADNAEPLDPAATKKMAKEKLEKEMGTAKDRDFAEPVIGYLLKRCGEDSGLAQDVMQEHKTWEKCLDYIYEQARKQATGNRAAVRDDVVYEWAEDYYHKDDKAEQEKKAKEAAERKKKEEERAKEAKSKTDKPKTPKPKEEPRPKKSGREMDGQLDMFSMMGM